MNNLCKRAGWMVASAVGGLLLVAFLFASSRAVANVSEPSRQAPPRELLTNGDFSDGTNGWWSGGNVNLDPSSGELDIRINDGGTNPWDVLLGQDNIAITAGANYTISLEARASTDTTILLLWQENGGAYTQYFNAPLSLTTSTQLFEFTFAGSAYDPIAQFQFQMGGQGDNINVYLDNVSLQTDADPPDETIVIRNGDFSEGLDPWWTTPSITPTLTGASGLTATIAAGGANPWDAIIGQDNVPLEAGQSYLVRFEASASEDKTVALSWQEDGDDFTPYFQTPLSVRTTPQQFIYRFEAPANDPTASFQFQLGGQGEFDIFLANVTVERVSPLPNEIGELLQNGRFVDELAPWWTTNSVNAVVTEDGLQAEITNGGTEPYDAILGQALVPIFATANYTLSFEAWASQPVTVNVLWQQEGGDYTRYMDEYPELTDVRQTFEYTFRGTADNLQASLQFHLGGQGEYTFYIDNVSLTGPIPSNEVDALPNVRLNQVGYIPTAPKRATIQNEAQASVEWVLYDDSDTAVWSGMTHVYGQNRASDEHVHIADFSAYQTPGIGYTLVVSGERSHPFDIRTDIYSQLKYDALAYFYHNRSGITLTMPYVGDPQWARAAGHIGIAPNQGDYNVPCFDQIDAEGAQWTGCNYTLDVVGGWYDAGDHGKYVVNGGISLWTMLNQYERTQFIDGADAVALADGRLNIPENSNGVADILDEARWQMEFMMAMQVPSGGMVEGELLEGMVHHKIADANWTGLGLPPSEDDEPRYLYPPSTAATLNMAATAAQCARIWAEIDADFAEQCLTAAETAWEAAVANPERYARNNFTGSGPYDDDDVTDEFYWAAAELFITTGDQAYLDYLTNSSHYLGMAGIDWGNVDSLGTISLALVPSALGDEAIAAARASVAARAHDFWRIVETEGYRLPYAGEDEEGSYAWGSNSAVMNYALVMALAYDFTNQLRYLEAVSESMDYLLGRNPMDKSYVSGYGERPLENPHHRFWAYQTDNSFPPPPPGVVSGGPNSSIQDPVASNLLAGCAPQVCYLDNIDSWSTNEITINWNAPFAWLVGFMDEQTTFTGQSLIHFSIVLAP